MGGGGGLDGGRTGVAPAGDRNALGHLPGTEPRGLQGEDFKVDRGVLVSKGIFGGV